MADGNFREDLYWRLSVLILEVPSLQERKEDIPDLIQHFLKEICQHLNLHVKRVAPPAMRLLLDYNWPGNIRQLRNTVERLTVLNESDMISAREVSAALKKSEEIAQNDIYCTLRKARESFEYNYIKQTLQIFKWNIHSTADALGIDRTCLWKKMKRFGITKQIKVSNETV